MLLIPITKLFDKKTRTIDGGSYELNQQITSTIVQCSNLPITLNIFIIWPITKQTPRVNKSRGEALWFRILQEISCYTGSVFLREYACDIFWCNNLFQ